MANMGVIGGDGISGLLGTGFLAALALGNDGSLEAGSQVVGKLVKLGVPVNLNGFLGGVAYHVAVVAPGKVIFEL